MEKIYYPNRKEWKDILSRPTIDVTTLYNVVSEVAEKIEKDGDSAVREYEERFDKVKLGSLAVSKEEMDEAGSLISSELKESIVAAYNNIKKFHEAQKFQGKKIETMQGVECWQKSVGIEKVGLYIPGGSAPLFSTVLMLAIPAKIAGCKEIVLCSPPNREGKINPAILFAAHTAGVDKIFKIGGIQAITAMAYGTESVPQVYKIFGPGNQYVMAAKQFVSLNKVAIDMPAGPSEVEVLADENANPVFIASDLLSQAEHGPDSQAILVTTSEELLLKVEKEIGRASCRERV